jgi:hypothetical protein
MSNDKPSFGFPTPAKEIENVFTKTQAELAKAKTNWKTIHSMLYNQYAEYSDGIEPKVKSKTISTGEVAILLQLVIAVSVAKMGTELTEVHERLANCERQIKDLKLAKK